MTATEMHGFAQQGDLPRLRALLATAVGQDEVHRRDWKGQTPLWWAACRDHAEAVKLLLGAGADLHGVDKDGRTLLWRVAWYGHAEVLQLLLEAGGDPEAVSKGGDTPLRVATGRGHAKVVQNLLTARADPNAADEDGRTSLWQAAFYDHDDLMKLLLAAGADLEAADKRGQTPLSIAESRGNAAVLKVVRQAQRAAADQEAAAKQKAAAEQEAAAEQKAAAEQRADAAEQRAAVAERKAAVSELRANNIEAAAQLQSTVKAAAAAALSTAGAAIERIAAPPAACPAEASRAEAAEMQRKAAAAAMSRVDSFSGDPAELAAMRENAVTLCNAAVKISNPADSAAAAAAAFVQHPAALMEMKRNVAELLDTLGLPAGAPPSWAAALTAAAASLKYPAAVSAAAAEVTRLAVAVHAELDAAAGSPEDAAERCAHHVAALRLWAEASLRFAGQTGRQRADDAAADLENCVESRHLAQRCLRKASEKSTVAIGALKDALEDKANVPASQRAADDAAAELLEATGKCHAAGIACLEAMDVATEALRFFSGHKALDDALVAAGKKLGSGAEKLTADAGEKELSSAAPLLRALRPGVLVDTDYRDEGPVDGNEHVRLAMRLSDEKRVILRAYVLGTAEGSAKKAREAGTRAVRAIKRLPPTLPPPAAGAATGAASLLVLPTTLFVSSASWGEMRVPALFLEMPYLPGGSLKARLDDADAGDDFALEEVVLLASRLAFAVALLHRAGIAHGDLTEANVVFWDREGTTNGRRPALIDFTDTASMDRTRTMTMGTPAALPSEASLAGGWHVTPELDCWQLGRLIKEAQKLTTQLSDNYLSSKTVDLLDRVITGLQSEIPGRMTAEHAAELLCGEVAAAGARAAQRDETERDMAEAAILTAVNDSPPWYWSIAEGYVKSRFALRLGDRVGVPVARADRVQNRILWRRYAADRAHVAATNRILTVPDQLDTASSGGGAWGVAAVAADEALVLAGVTVPNTSHVSSDQACRVRANRDLFPEPAANEALLFHGTDAGTAQLIAAGGFDPSRCGDKVGARFGAATCFTPDPAKARRYAGAGGVVIVARVILGAVLDVALADDEVAQLRRAQLADGEEHDSVLGFNGQPGAVVCIYRHARAYPELLLHLK